MAEAFPRSRFVGSDYHAGSVEAARERAAEAGVGDRVRFEVSGAQSLEPGTSTWSPRSTACTTWATRSVRRPGSAAASRRDGTWMIVEPAAGDTVEANLNPVGRVYYGFSTFLCVPNAMSQPGGYALGAQAGEAAIRQVVTDAGFTRFRRVAETPFNLVFEARP